MRIVREVGRLKHATVLRCTAEYYETPTIWYLPAMISQPILENLIVLIEAKFSIDIIIEFLGSNKIPWKIELDGMQIESGDRVLRPIFKSKDTYCPIDMD